MKTRFASYSLLAALCLSAAGCASPSSISLGAPSASKASSEGKATPGSAATGTATGGGSVGAGRDEATTSTAKPASGPIANNGGGLIGNGGNLVAGEAAGDMAAPASRPLPAASSAPMAPPPSGAGFAPGEPAPGMPAPMPPVQTQESLKAGAVDDNKDFKDYLQYVKDFVWENAVDVARPRALDVSKRHIVRVVDANGKGVANARVTVKVGEAIVQETLTYADGRTLFHEAVDANGGAAATYTVSATKGDQAMAGTFGSAAADWEVKLKAAVEKPAAKVDMAIVLDTTGSMGGEISKFKSTISSIASRLQALPQQPSVRFGLVAYKDQREQYVSKVASPFTAEIGTFQAALNGLSAGGGGDKPEDLEAALGDTVNTLQWDAGDAVRLSFIVTDAAAHTNYPQSTPYTDSMKIAAGKGIKLYPIGASGLEEEGEYALRQLAQWTMGQYLFVTRGGDEATGGGGTASATVDKFREGRLDDIVVDIVKAELDKLGQ